MERTRILVWDLPLRIVHWSLAAAFAVAFVTGDSERYRGLHVVAGYAMLALIAFRITWAVVGTRYARLASFMFGPRAVVRYLRSLLARDPPHYVGHNPAGSWMIFALVLAGVLAGATGWALDRDLAGHWLEEIHETATNTMLALVIVHLAGVAVASVLHRENLARAMVTGYKKGEPQQAIPSARWMTASILVLALILLLRSLPDASLLAGGGDDPGRPSRQESSRSHYDGPSRGR
jgi:cytochrome b